VLLAGGKVQRLKDPRFGWVGPYRVWQRNGFVPGLAMSRSFGDLMGAHVGNSFIKGVSAEPTITHHKLTETNNFLILGSDGVFDFQTNDKLMKLTSPFYEANNPEQAVQKLYSESHLSWKQNDGVVDDITALCVFFKPLT
jgi:serine/threonine protein phosphatase PrpC